MKRLLSGILLLAVGMMCACVGGSGHKQALSKAEKARQARLDSAAFKVAVMPTLDCLPLYLMHDSNYYDSAQVDVRLRRFTAHMDIDTALVGGSVQAAATERVRVARLRSRVGLRELASTPLEWALITNRRARITELSQLSDKMVAMTRFSATDELTDLAVKKGKPKYYVFHVQINSVPLRLSMLKTNEMDAMWLPQPQWAMALQAGHKQLMDSGKGHYGVLVVRTADVPARQKQLQAFVAGYNKACDAINARGVRQYAALIKKYMGANDKAIDKLPNLKYNHAEY